MTAAALKSNSHVVLNCDFVPKTEYRSVSGVGPSIGHHGIPSLDRERVDFASDEARIIGKGNKQRVVFFTRRALSWLNRYLAARPDTHPALFATQTGEERLDRANIWRSFARCRKLAGINKFITPHVLRHTAATQLLFNGCPVGHI